MSPILEVQNVTMRFGGIVANRDVSFAVERGEVTALIGPNGAGKTTMFNCITGFYRSSEGRIMLNGRDGPTDIGQLVTKRVAGGSHLVTRAGIARTFQNIRLFKEMSVIENLLVAQHLATRNNILSGVFRTGAFRKAEAEAVDRAYHWLGQTSFRPRQPPCRRTALRPAAPRRDRPRHCTVQASYASTNRLPASTPPKRWISPRSSNGSVPITSRRFSSSSTTWVSSCAFRTTSSCSIMAR